jgi:hypothetical protein
MINLLSTYNKKKLPTTSYVYNTYWKFAAERQNIYYNRLYDQEYPWTDDAIINKYKFTNAYRASDRVSQYLIKNVIYKGDQSPEEVFFRIILFKIFNKIATWELIEKQLGTVRYSEYNFERYEKILLNVIRSGKAIYSGAYIMASGKSFFGYDIKFKNHLRLIELLMKDEVPKRIIGLKKMEDVYNLLKSYPSIGNFLAYQYTIDINYSNLTSFDEMEFVVPGPGAKDGISKCFIDRGDFSESEIIKYVTENQENEFFKRGIDFKTLWGRPLQLIDCQNLFCEVDKYSRLAHPEINGNSKRKRIKQQFSYNPKKIEYWYPPKWGLNPKISTNFILNEELSGQYC